MSPANSAIAKMSARSAYKAAQEEKRGRGRPRKYPLPISSSSTNKKPVAHKKLRKSKKSKVQVENNSSEADCSSEGEDVNSDKDCIKIGKGEHEIDGTSEDDEDRNENDTADEGDLVDEDEENSTDEEHSENEEYEENSEDNENDDKATAENEPESSSDSDENVRYSFAVSKHKSSVKKVYSMPGPSSKKRTQKQNSSLQKKTPKKGSSPQKQTPKRSSSPQKQIPKRSSSPQKQTPKRGPSPQKKTPKRGSPQMQIPKRDSFSEEQAHERDSSSQMQAPKRDSFSQTQSLKRKAPKKEIEDDDKKSFSSPKKIRKVESEDTCCEKLVDMCHSSMSVDDLISMACLCHSAVKQERPQLFGSPLNSILSFTNLNRSSPSGNIAADEGFRWFLHPLEPEKFYEDVFEQRPYYINRTNQSYYKDLFNGSDLDTMLKENHLEYGVHMDVLKYVNQKRQYTEDAEGRAHVSSVWEDYNKGYSVRIRNPITFNKKLWCFCSLLEDYFTSSVGVNIYLTPPNSQGFPPHYDDIDAFIAQVEGSKHWKIYEPISPFSKLDRYPSRDFKKHEIGMPIMEVTLKAGDALYIPRGYIHQASCTDQHSLHLTFSTNQLNTYGDLLLTATKKAVEKAICRDIEFRKALPRSFMDLGGSVVSCCNSIDKQTFRSKMSYLAKRTLDFLDIDAALDDHSLRFIQTSLPLSFNNIEKRHSVHGNGNRWNNGSVLIKEDITEDMEVKLIRKRNLRLIVEESVSKLYHNLENSKDAKSLAAESSENATYVEFDNNGIPAFTCLWNKYPNFIKVKDLKGDATFDKVVFANALYDHGILMTKEPLKLIEGDHITY